MLELAFALLPPGSRDMCLLGSFWMRSNWTCAVQVTIDLISPLDDQVTNKVAGNL